MSGTALLAGRFGSPAGSLTDTGRADGSNRVETSLVWGDEARACTPAGEPNRTKDNA